MCIRDRNKPTGLYGATGAMRVWSGIFSRLPSKPLEVGNDGLDWQWIYGSHATDASCPGVRRFAFVQGYAPGYEACEIAPPVQVDEFGNPIEPVDPAQESSGGSWRDFFGLGDRRAPQDPATTPPPAQQPPPPPPSR